MKSAHTKRRVVKSFPARRTDTITRANIIQTLLYSEKSLSSEEIAQRILNSKHEVGKRRMNALEKRLGGLLKGEQVIVTREHGRQVWALLRSAEA